jgi:signal peptidase I
MVKVYVGVALLLLVAGCGDSDRVVQSFVFEGHSMTPTLEHGDPIVAFDYKGAAPARGDVVAFAAPTSPERVFFKRVIGLPGDTVEINAATDDVLINGAVLEESYVSSTTGCLSECWWQVPPAPNGVSIRFSDYEPRRHFEEEREERDACMSRGCYFVMGDNRQNSSDSRAGWLVPAENIMGVIEVGSATIQT